MSNKVDVVLWEDLTDVQTRIRKTLEALQSLDRALAEDQVSQPTRENSNHLTRLNVLADLLYNEVCQFVEDIPFRTKVRA
jgi:hypothetical protein